MQTYFSYQYSFLIVFLFLQWIIWSIHIAAFLTIIKISLLVVINYHRLYDWFCFDLHFLCCRLSKNRLVINLSSESSLTYKTRLHSFLGDERLLNLGSVWISHIKLKILFDGLLNNIVQRLDLLWLSLIHNLISSRIQIKQIMSKITDRIWEYCCSRISSFKFTKFDSSSKSQSIGFLF